MSPDRESCRAERDWWLDEVKVLWSEELWTSDVREVYEVGDSRAWTRSALCVDQKSNARTDERGDWSVNQKLDKVKEKKEKNIEKMMNEGPLSMDEVYQREDIEAMDLAEVKFVEKKRLWI